jgi:hypothetical protein
MTIDILFFAKEKLVVLRLNMCRSSLGDKILDKVTDEELDFRFTMTLK